jgi:hypothetical protein
MKLCAKCGQHKPILEFENLHRCKTCQAKLDKQDAEMRRRYAHDKTVAMLRKQVKPCANKHCDNFLPVGRQRICDSCRNPVNKYCPRCECLKPAELFSINTRSVDGLQSYCKACNKDSYTPASVSLNKQGIPRRKPCIECRRTLPAKAFTLHKPGQLSLACIECTNKETRGDLP